MASDGPYLVAALSGRALAAAARRAGARAVVLDLFGDLDTRALAAANAVVPGALDRGFDAEALLAAAERLAPAGQGAGLVYGAGFEARPDLLAALARGRRLFGNPPEVVARAKDPARFFGLLDRLGLPHPEIRLARPADVAGWLSKRIGASGGGHVRPVGAEEDDGRYYQRRVDGDALSALFLADGREARLLGISVQWSAPDGGRQSYRFGGAACPAQVGPRLARAVEAAIHELTQALGLVGLNSLDLLAEGDRFAVLEVNPRPGATLDIFDDPDPRSALFGLHLDACEGRLPRDWTLPDAARAAAIVYADQGVRVGAELAWPGWTADRPAAGTEIGPGDPVCTVLASAATVEAARAQVAARAEAVRSALGMSGRREWRQHGT